MPFCRESKHRYNNIQQYKILSTQMAHYFKTKDRNDLNRRRSVKSNVKIKVVLNYSGNVRKNEITGHYPHQMLGCPERHKSTLKSTLIAGRKS
jgi:hypothetical protein